MHTAVALFLFTLFLSGLPAVLPAAEEPPACEPAAKWEEAGRADPPERRLSLLQEAAVACPGNLLIVDALGKLLLKQNHPEAAANALRSGLARTPGFIKTLLRAAEAEIAVKNYAQALWFFRVARAIDPAHPGVVKFFRDLEDFRPISRRKAGNENEMLKVFFEGRRARDRLREKPDDSAARRTYAVFLLAQARGLSETGESKQADALIRHAIQLDPQYRPAREAMVKQIIEKGDFSLRAEDYPEALKRYRSALQWMPDSIPAHLRIAAALQRIRGKREESLAAYNRARELLQAKPRQGSPRERAGWSREIEEGLTRVDVRNPVYRARAARREIDKAESATRQGRLGETVEAYKRALQWTPEDGILHATLADTLRYVEDGWKDAIRHYGLAIRYLEKNPPAGMNPKELKRRIRHAERERAGLEKSHTGTIAYIRSKVLLAVRERRVEALLFLLVYGAALVLLWRSKPANGND